MEKLITAFALATKKFLQYTTMIALSNSMNTLSNSNLIYGLIRLRNLMCEENLVLEYIIIILSLTRIQDGC